MSRAILLRDAAAPKLLAGTAAGFAVPRLVTLLASTAGESRCVTGNLQTARSCRLCAASLGDAGAPLGSEPVTCPRYRDGDRLEAREGTSRARTLLLGQAAYWLALLICCSLLGIVIGGYVGYIDAATPAAEAPGNLSRLATSDVQWATMVRQYCPARRSHESAERDTRKSFWQRFVWNAISHSEQGVLGDAPPQAERDGYPIRDDMPAADPIEARAACGTR